MRVQFVPDERAARVHFFMSRFAGTMVPTNRTEIGPRASHDVLEDSSRSWIEIVLRTIAHLMLVPCSVSSMLFAALRPGRRPGLRALTTPPRGTFQAVARWWPACRSLE
jgi:hypothetical protein